MKIISVQYDSVFTASAWFTDLLIDIDLTSLYKINARPPMLRGFLVKGKFTDMSSIESFAVDTIAWIEPQSGAQILTGKGYDLSIDTDFGSGGGVVTKSNRICLASNNDSWHGKVDLFDKIRIGCNMNGYVNVGAAIGDTINIIFNLEIDV